MDYSMTNYAKSAGAEVQQNPSSSSISATNQHSFKPIPKPRKSLMNNPPTSTSLAVGTTDDIIIGKPEQTNNLNGPLPRPPPPLPPRTAAIGHFSDRPLPPIPALHHPVITTPSNNNNCVRKIYPILDDLLLCSPSSTPTTPPILLLTDWPTTTMGSASSTTSSSEFSSSDDCHTEMLDSPVATVPATSSSSFGCEPFGGAQKSDGVSVCFSGWVQLAPGAIKHRKRGWAMVRNNEFSISQDEESLTPFFGPFDMSKCVLLGRTVGATSEITMALRKMAKGRRTHKMVTLANGGGTHSLLTLRFTPIEHHEYWLALLAKCCSPRNDLFPQEEELPMVDCCGKLWVKQGVSGLWQEGWAYAHRRILCYWVQQGANSTVAELDIRKTLLVKQGDLPQSDWCNHIEHSSSGPLLIALEGRSLYLQSEFDQCTAVWLNFLNAELRKDADTLEECRLTTEDIPVIVEKCIGLVATYGMLQPGIYRKNGSAAEAKRIMHEFREDPYTVHLNPPITDETINAVADVLRTFFRQLRIPLLPVPLHPKLFEISNFPSDAKVSAYRELILPLPKAHYGTLKKLLGHLQEVVSHEDRNKASLDNISKVFGPTLFNPSNSSDQCSVDYSTATKQALVLHDLIFHYCDIFDVKAEELLAKCKLEAMLDQKATSKATATGLLIPIHLFSRDNKCFNVQSEWTAAQVVSFKIQKLAFVSPCEPYALFEMVKNGQLERRIGANETLRSIVLGRWLDWEEQQSNFLLLKKDNNPFQPQSGRAFAEDVRFAEPCSRSFKHASLRIEDGVHVCHYTKHMKRQCQWKLDEMLWFVGAETERRCPHPYALTFFVSGEKKAAASGCRGGKFPGYCVGFKDEIQRLQWLNQVIVSTQEYLPMPIIQI